MGHTYHSQRVLHSSYSMARQKQPYSLCLGPGGEANWGGEQGQGLERSSSKIS